MPIVHSRISPVGLQPPLQVVHVGQRHLEVIPRGDEEVGQDSDGEEENHEEGEEEEPLDPGGHVPARPTARGGVPLGPGLSVGGLGGVVDRGGRGGQVGEVAGGALGRGGGSRDGDDLPPGDGPVLELAVPQGRVVHVHDEGVGARVLVRGRGAGAAVAAAGGGSRPERRGRVGVVGVVVVALRGVPVAERRKKWGWGLTVNVGGCG